LSPHRIPNSTVIISAIGFRTFVSRLTSVIYNTQRCWRWGYESPLGSAPPSRLAVSSSTCVASCGPQSSTAGRAGAASRLPGCVMKNGGPTTGCWSPMLDDNNGEDTFSCDARSIGIGAIADLAAKGSCSCRGGTIITVGIINEALGAWRENEGEVQGRRGGVWSSFCRGG